MRASLQRALETWHTCLAIGTLAAESQSVIAYRSLGFLGGWSLERDENQRMISENPAAFLAANLAAVAAMISGKCPDQVTLAWVRPLSAAVGSNRTRLQGRGPAGPAALFRNSVL